MPKRSISSGRASVTKSRRVIAKHGEQSARMAALASLELARRGIIIGTAITPARRQAKNATMKSKPGENSRTALSPFCPRSARLTATARARV